MRWLISSRCYCWGSNAGSSSSHWMPQFQAVNCSTGITAWPAALDSKAGMSSSDLLAGLPACQVAGRQGT
jgi:hypothetical protein